MKVVQVNSVYGRGSTGKIVQGLHGEYRARGMGSAVLYGRGPKVREEGVAKVGLELEAHATHVGSLLTGVMYGGAPLGTVRLERAIEREAPDVVHLQCVNGYFANVYRLLGWLRDGGVPTVLTLHAEFMFTGGCGYAYDCEGWKAGCGGCPQLGRGVDSLGRDGTARSWSLMREGFEGFDRLVVASVSPWLRGRAEQSPFLRGKRHEVVENGVDCSVFRPRRGTRDGGATPTVFHATASFSDEKGHGKGGWYVLEMARRHPEWRFTVAGEHRLSEEPPTNVELLGPISDQDELARLYSSADATLLTSRRETFSMVTVESLCCGTPVAGFEAGGPESIALAGYSRFVGQGDLPALEAAVSEMIDAPFDSGRIAAEAEREYSMGSCARKYIELYNEVAKQAE